MKFDHYFTIIVNTSIFIFHVSFDATLVRKMTLFIGGRLGLWQITAPTAEKAT
jgi:hypothetical protein